MSGDDLPPDPRLRAALRHAPDADVQAPPQLRAQLLAAARDAVAPKTPWWQRWWSPSPLGASGAFATLLLAGVIGLLWRGEPPPAVVEQAAPASVVAAPAPEPLPAAAAPAPQARRAETQALADRAAAAARKTQRQAEQATAKAANAAAAERAAAPERAAESSAGALADAAPQPATPPAPPPAAPPPPAPAEARRAPATRMAALAPAPSTLRTDWLAAGVTWQIDGAAPAAADSAWLRELLRLAEGRWQPTPPRAVPGARQLLLSSGDAWLALSLGDAEVLWCDAAAPCRAAPLSADEARRLRDGLPR